MALEAILPGKPGFGAAPLYGAGLAEKVPADFWADLREAGLVNREAPLPA